MRLVRYNPFNEMALFKNAFTDFFNDPVLTGTGADDTWAPAVDILDRKDHVLVNVELPGVSKEDISVNIEERVLTITGERKMETVEEKEDYYRRESRYGRFKRAFTLSEEILTDEVNAEFKDGILRVTLKKNQARDEVRQITIN